MLTREQIELCAGYADLRAYDDTLGEWLVAFCWYARQLAGSATVGYNQTHDGNCP